MPGADPRKRNNHAYLKREGGNPDDGGAHDRKRNGFGRRTRSSVASGGAQRSGEFDELRDHGFPTRLRLSARESRETHVGSASQRPIDFVERHAGAGRALCATTARLSPAGYNRKDRLIWRFAAAKVRSRSRNWTRSWPNCFGKFLRAPTQMARRLPNNGSSVLQQMKRKLSFVRSGKPTSSLSCDACFSRQRRQWRAIWSN